MSEKVMFNARETRKLVKRYTVEGWSLQRLANEYGHTLKTMRRVLIDNGVTIRPQGRPAGSKNRS